MIRQLLEITTTIEKSQTELEALRGYLLRAQIKPHPLYMRNSIKLMLGLDDAEWEPAKRVELTKKATQSLEAPDGQQIAIPTPRHWCLFAISRIREAIGSRYMEAWFSTNLPQPGYVVIWDPSTDPDELQAEWNMLSVQGEKVAREEPAGSGLVVLDGGRM